MKLKKLNPNKKRDIVELSGATTDEVLRPKSRFITYLNKRKNRTKQISETRLDLTPVKKGKLARRVNPFFPLTWTLRYIRDSYRELKLVTWPDNKSTFKMTGTVLIFAAILSAFIFGIDLGLNNLFKSIFNQI